MDKIKIYPRRSCDECVFKEFEEEDCLISELSGWNCEHEREIYNNPEVIYGEYESCDDYKQCLVRLPYYETEDIIKWFFETQKDKIEYIDKE